MAWYLLLYRKLGIFSLDLSSEVLTAQEHQQSPLLDSHCLLQDVRVNGSHAIDSMRAHDGQVGHIQPLLVSFLHDGEGAKLVHVSRPAHINNLNVCSSHKERGRGWGEGARGGGGTGKRKFIPCNK